MTRDELAATLADRRMWIAGKRVKLDFGADGLIYLDGVDGRVSAEDGAADAVIAVSWADLQALGRGELDPVGALMQGRLRVSGDMGVAMQLPQVLGQLRE
jgi:putative sterol carrier protein